MKKSVIETMSIRLEALREFERLLTDKIHDIEYVYKKVGTSDVPKRDWKTDEIKKDENGAIVYEDIYDYVKREELEDFDIIRKEVFQEMLQDLPKLIK